MTNAVQRNKSSRIHIHSDALLGASLFMMLVAHCVPGDSSLRPVLYSVYAPMIYALLGYRDAEHKDAVAGCTQGDRRFLLENMQVLFSGAALVIGISLVDYCRLSEPSLAALVNMLQDDIIRLFYMSGVDYSGHGSVGVVCLYGSVALVRISYRYIRQMITHVLYSMNAAVMCVGAGVLCALGVELARRDIWLPLSLDISCVGILFYSLGAAYSELREHLASIERETDYAVGESVRPEITCRPARTSAEHGRIAVRILTAVRVTVTILCASYWICCLNDGCYIEIAIRSYRDARVIVEAAAAIYVVIQVGDVILRRVPHIGRILAIVGRHPFLFVGFHVVDMYLAFLWNVADLCISTLLKCIYGTSIIATIQCVRQSAGVCMNEEDSRTARAVVTWYEGHRREVDLVFYVFYAVVLALEMLRSTMFTQTMNWIIYDRLYMVGMDGLFAVVLLRFTLPRRGLERGDESDGCERSAYIRQTILRFILLITCLMLWNLNGLTALMVLGFLMIGAEGTSARRILQIYLVIGLAEVVMMYWASTHGYIAYLYYASRDAHAMGSIYRTDYAARWLYLFVAYNILRGRRLRLVEYIAEGCLIYYVFHMTAGKTFLISAPLFLVLCYLTNNLSQLCHKGIRGTMTCNCMTERDLDKNTSTTTMRRALDAISSLLIPLCAVFSYVIVLVLGPHYRNIGNPGGTMSTTIHRITLSYEAFLQYPIRLFSQSVTEQGAGGIVDLSAVTYFFLDNSYIRMLIIYGVAFLIIMLAVHVMLMRRSCRESQHIVWCALVAIAIDSISEHHLSAFSYNILPVIIWARWNHL